MKNFFVRIMPVSNYTYLDSSLSLFIIALLERFLDSQRISGGWKTVCILFSSF